jgi:outer membrane murein-binding lipoprotein Lpp
MKSFRSVFAVTFCLIAAGLVAGCDEFLIGAGAGLAGAETFAAWQQNLEAKKAELQAQYDLVLAELQAAPDPNAVRLAKEKLTLIADQQLVNEGALLAVRAALERTPPEATPEDDRDFYAAVAAGGLAWLYEFATKRKLNTKYVAHKAGQANLKVIDPDAEAKLYAQIGLERAKLGL